MPVGDAIEKTMNRLAGTTGLGTAGAANVWAGTTNREFVEALNIKAGNTLPNYRDYDGVARQLATALGGAGTSGMSGDGLLASIP